MAEHKMVTVDGVRYRPEDAPRRTEDRHLPGDGDVKHKRRKPAKRGKGGADEHADRPDSGTGDAEHDSG